MVFLEALGVAGDDVDGELDPVGDDGVVVLVELVQRPRRHHPDYTPPHFPPTPHPPSSNFTLPSYFSA